MAYQNGTATDYLDLLDKLQTFASTDAGLVAAGQNWTVEKWGGKVTGTELYLRGPGLSGTDSIYVGIRAYEDATADWFNWAIRPFLGYLSSATWATQPGAGPERGLALWDRTMNYWLVANGNRIILVVQVSTVYQIMHLGFFTPYALPSQYPYPIMVGGTMDAAQEWRWSNTSANHRFFHTAGVNAPIRYIEGTWLTGLSSWPYSLGGTVRESFGDQWPLFPIVFSDTHPNIYGELDGLYWIPGFSNAAGNTLTIDSQDYLVVQNVFRTSNNDYVALRLA